MERGGKKSSQLSGISSQKYRSDGEKLLADNRTKYYLLWAFILTFVFATLQGCTENFQALEENDQYYFSMYGYLDASADTQWVRITPARERVDALEEVPDMNVIIENMDTGNTITMKDSLFQNRGATYINFWTTDPIEHTNSYRVVAEKPDGSKSEAIAYIPDELPTPKVIIETSFGFPTTYSVEVDGSVHVADVQSKWYVHLKAPNLSTRRVFTFSHRNNADTTEANGGSYSFHLKPDEELSEIENQVLLPEGGEIEVVHRQIYVASTSVDWISNVSSLDDLTYALPETFSNVENGVGFITGIDSKYVPYESCENESKTQIIPCTEEAKFWN